MIIGVDGNEANISTRVGVNQYAFQILWNIYRLQDSWKEKYKFIVYLKDNPRKDLPKQKVFWQYKVLPGRSLWIITKLIPHLFFTKVRPDIFFSPSHYIPPFAPMPRVCAIMDMGFLEFSEQFRKRDYWQLRLWSAWSINISKRIIAISRSTARDIVRHFPFASKKVFVTPLAYDKEVYNPNVSIDDVRRVRRKYSIVDDYILFLGTLKPSKNIEGLLKAWKIIADKFPKILLVIAGKKGWLFDNIFKEVERMGLKKCVKFIGFVDESDKPALISAAKLFVMPSFWEGFGLDALSSMACGVPVVVSDRGSLPEVVGEAGIIVNPEKPEEIAEGIEKILRASKNEYNKIVKRGFAQVKKFSWQKTAQKTLQILRDAL